MPLSAACRDFVGPSIARSAEFIRAIGKAINAGTSKRAAAKMLAIGRCNALETLIVEGKVRTVMVAGRVRIPLTEIDRITARGTEASHPRKRNPRYQPPKSSGRRAADRLDRFLARH